MENEIKNLYEQGLTMQKVADQLNISSATVHRKLHKMDVSIRRKHSNINETYFNNPNTEQSSYWAGFIAADGYIDTYKKGNAQNNVLIEINQKDKHHLVKLGSSIGKNVTDYLPHNSCKLNITSNHICNKLEEYNITSKKSLTLQFPNNINNQNIHHFIRGYFDGDGCFFKNYQILGTKDFLQSLINNLPFDCSYSLKSPKNTKYFLLRIRKASIIDFFKFMYKNATIYLDRKYQKQLAFYNKEISSK